MNQSHSQKENTIQIQINTGHNIEVYETLTCPPHIGPRYVNAFQTDSRWGGVMGRVGTDFKPRANNSLLGVKKGFRTDAVDAGNPLQ